MHLFALLHSLEFLWFVTFPIEFRIVIALRYLVNSFQFSHNLSQFTLFQVVVSLTFQHPDAPLDIFYLAVTLLRITTLMLKQVVQLQILPMELISNFVTIFPLFERELIAAITLQSVEKSRVFPLLRLQYFCDAIITIFFSISITSGFARLRMHSFVYFYLVRKLLDRQITAIRTTLGRSCPWVLPRGRRRGDATL